MSQAFTAYTVLRLHQLVHNSNWKEHTSTVGTNRGCMHCTIIGRSKPPTFETCRNLRWGFAKYHSRGGSEWVWTGCRWWRPVLLEDKARYWKGWSSLRSTRQLLRFGRSCTETVMDDVRNEAIFYNSRCSIASAWFLDWHQFQYWLRLLVWSTFWLRHHCSSCWIHPLMHKKRMHSWQWWNLRFHRNKTRKTLFRPLKPLPHILLPGQYRLHSWPKSWL